MIKLVISVSNGRLVKQYQVRDDKRPGGLHRMQQDALHQAGVDSDFNRGETLFIVTNWVKYL